MKSTDAFTSGGNHMCGTRIPPGTAPKDLLIASGMFEGSYRADPVVPYLVLAGRSLKGLCQLFERARRVFNSAD